MLLSLMIPAVIILFLLSALLYKEENDLASNKQSINSRKNRTTGDLCCEKINNGDKSNPKDYIDLSGGNLGI